MVEEKQSISISKTEYDALQAIRGLSSDAHLMVMCAHQLPKTGNYLLQGSADDFEALASDLSEEICHELYPPTRTKHLTRLYDRLNPPDGEF